MLPLVLSSGVSLCETLATDFACERFAVTRVDQFVTNQAVAVPEMLFALVTAIAPVNGL